MRWNCPKCNCINIDSPKLTMLPMCEQCDTSFQWDNIPVIRLGNAVRYAKQNKLNIEVHRYDTYTALIINQPLYSGYGAVVLHVHKSHRTADRLRQWCGAYEFYPTTLHNSAWKCNIRNDKSIIDQALKLPGVSMKKKQAPQPAVFYVFKDHTVKEVQS